MRVLVVEDEKKVAKALRDGLEAERYDVSVAASGEEGFFLVNHEIFDLVLLDLMLPRRNGIEVLTTLRKRGLQTSGAHSDGEGRRGRSCPRASTAVPTTTSSNPSRFCGIGSVASALGGLLGGRCPRMADYVRGLPAPQG